MDLKKAVNTFYFYWVFVKFLKSFCYRSTLDKEQYIRVGNVL